MAEEADIAFPFFFIQAEADDRATKLNGGIPVFQDVEMVRIQIPGFRDEVVRPVEDRDKERWPRMYERFKAGETQKLDGIPLSEFATAKESERAVLKSLGIQTVEQAAGLNDDAAQKMHIIALRKKAQEFLKTRENLANVGQLEARVKELERELKKLRDGNGENANAVVSGSDEGDRVQPAKHVPVQSVPGRPEVGGTVKRGRQRTGGKAQVA